MRDGNIVPGAVPVCRQCQAWLPAQSVRNAVTGSTRVAQQMSSTKPTAPRNSVDVCRRSPPITTSCKGKTATPRPALVFGYSRASPSARAVREAEIIEELSEHLDLRYEELRNGGAGEEQSRAHRRSGRP